MNYISSNYQSTKRSVGTGIFFCSITKFLINFCKQFKDENTVMNLVFKSFPQISISQLISTIHGIIEIELSGLQSKIINPRYFSESPFEKLKLSCEILIVEIPPVLLQKRSLTIEKSLDNSHFCQVQPMKVLMQGSYFGIRLSRNLMHVWSCPLRPCWKKSSR